MRTFEILELLHTQHPTIFVFFADLLDTGQNRNPFISEAEKIRQLNMNEIHAADNEYDNETNDYASGPSLNPFEGFENFGIVDAFDSGEKAVSDIPDSGSFEEEAYLHQYTEDPNPFLSAASQVYNINIDDVSDVEPDLSPVDNDRNEIKTNFENSDQDTGAKGDNSAPFLDALGLEYLAARPKARKSISLIVEVENADNLDDLTEADFYDKIQTPSPGHSGCNSPFVNSGVSTPFESVSAVHSLRASTSDSGYPSVTQTPPNSMIEGGYPGAKDFDLPSFNNAEMVARIQKKKASIGAGVDLLGLIPEPGDTPYTPQNSFREDSDVLSSDQLMPSLNNDAFMKRIQEKRSSLSVARENTSAEKLDFEEVKRDEPEIVFGESDMDPFRGKVNSPNFDSDGFERFAPDQNDEYGCSDMNDYASEHISDWENAMKGGPRPKKESLLSSLIEIEISDQDNNPLSDPFGLNIQPTDSSESTTEKKELYPSDKSRNLLSDLTLITPANSYVENKSHFMETRKSIPDDKELLDKLMDLKDKMNQAKDDEDNIHCESGVDCEHEVSLGDNANDLVCISLQDNPCDLNTLEDNSNEIVIPVATTETESTELKCKDDDIMYFPSVSVENTVDMDKEVIRNSFMDRNGDIIPNVLMGNTNDMLQEENFFVDRNNDPFASDLVGNILELDKEENFLVDSNDDPYASDLLGNTLELNKEENRYMDRNGDNFGNDLDAVLSKFGPEISVKANEQALVEIATSFAKEVIADAIERFPEVKNPAVANVVAMEVFDGEGNEWLKQISQDSASSGSQGMFSIYG